MDGFHGSETGAAFFVHVGQVSVRRFHGANVLIFRAGEEGARARLDAIVEGRFKVESSRLGLEPTISVPSLSLRRPVYTRGARTFIGGEWNFAYLGLSEVLFNHVTFFKGELI